MGAIYGVLPVLHTILFIPRESEGTKNNSYHRHAIPVPIVWVKRSRKKKKKKVKSATALLTDKPVRTVILHYRAYNHTEHPSLHADRTPKAEHREKSNQMGPVDADTHQ